MRAIDKAIALAGGQASLAMKAGVSQPTVHGWQTGEKLIKAENALRVCRALNFQVLPHELRGDVYPYPDDAVPHELRNMVEVGNGAGRSGKPSGSQGM